MYKPCGGFCYWGWDGIGKEVALGIPRERTSYSAYNRQQYRQNRQAPPIQGMEKVGPLIQVRGTPQRTNHHSQVAEYHQSEREGGKIKNKNSLQQYRGTSQVGWGVGRGLRQGCSLSMILYMIFTEILRQGKAYIFFQIVLMVKFHTTILTKIQVLSPQKKMYTIPTCQHKKNVSMVNTSQEL